MSAAKVQYALIVETDDDGAALAGFKSWLKCGGRRFGVRVRSVADPAAAEAAARARFYAEQFAAVAQADHGDLVDGELQTGGGGR